MSLHLLVLSRHHGLRRWTIGVKLNEAKTVSFDSSQSGSLVRYEGLELLPLLTCDWPTLRCKLYVITPELVGESLYYCVTRRRLSDKT